jgi:hypothetical protein
VVWAGLRKSKAVSPEQPEHRGLEVWLKQFSTCLLIRKPWKYHKKWEREIRVESHFWEFLEQNKLVNYGQHQ